MDKSLNFRKLGLLIAIVLGVVGSCKKTEPTYADVTSDEVSGIATTQASVKITIAVKGNYEITDKGVCYSTTSNPTTSNNKISEGSGSMSFTSTMKQLSAGVRYYVRGYIVNKVGETQYSNQVSFVTLSASPGGGTGGTGTTVTVSTNSISGITSTAATGGGTIVSNVTIYSTGLCWSTSPNPTTSSSKTNEGNVTGPFTSEIKALTPATTYYVRAYATSSNETHYGAQVTFTTAAASGGGTTPIAVTTNSVSGITGVAGNSGGTITGTGTVTARGICWSTSQNPTVALSTKTTNGSGTGSFTSSMANLTPGTTYYVRAYATTSTETTYGNQVSFATSAGTITVTTDKVEYPGYYASVTATAKGTLEIIAMGVCYSASPNPTLSNDKVAIGLMPQINGGTSNVWITAIACVKYYARAYATVKGGATYYGNELTFMHTNILNDCHPFNGNWRNAANTITLLGNANHFMFIAIAPNAKPEINWRGALDANLIKVGTSGGFSDYISDIVRTGERTWTCRILWHKGSTSNNIVTEVKAGPATMTLSTDGKEISISGSSPFGTGPGSTVLYKL